MKNTEIDFKFIVNHLGVIHDFTEEESVAIDNTRYRSFSKLGRKIVVEYNWTSKWDRSYAPACFIFRYKGAELFKTAVVQGGHTPEGCNKVDADFAGIVIHNEFFTITSKIEANLIENIQKADIDDEYKHLIKYCFSVLNKKVSIRYKKQQLEKAVAQQEITTQRDIREKRNKTLILAALKEVSQAPFWQSNNKAELVT